MEFFHLLKASQKSGKKDAVIWFTAKSAARANLQLDVALEEAGIEETGRGKDYAKPIRTDFPVYNDLPEEGAVDYTWCERYELQEDGRTWLPKAGAGSPEVVGNTAAPETTVKVETTDESVTLENRTPAVRFAFHLSSDKYQTHISKEQQLAASEMSLDEGNTYLQNLLQAKNDIPEIAELSLNAEWKLVQAVKDIFPQDKEHECALLATFMSSWIKAEAGDRTQLVDYWKSGKLPATAEGDVGTTSENVCDAVREFRERELPVLTTVATLPFRQRLLAQYIADKQYFYHVDEEQKKAILKLELDVDNSYVQNMILAAENVEGFKKAHEPDIWKVVNALKTIFPVDGKRTELSVVIQFFKAWFSTEHIDLGILTREWSAGNRISNVQRPDAGTNADGGYVTDRGADAHHTLDTLDLEIACALLPMDFNHQEIPGSILRRAKEIVTKKEEPWKSWSSILRNQPGVLAVNRTAIFNLVRIAPENIHLTPVAHLEFVNRTMTTKFNEATELMPIRAASERQESENPDAVADSEMPEAQPGGAGKTDRNPNYKPDFNGLDTEIALATLSTDFNIYDIPTDAYNRAKDIVVAKDSPFKEWSAALRNIPGILDYSRAAIFALIRSAHPSYYLNPARLAGYIRANLTETDHENPSAEVLAAARHTPEVSWESEVNEQIEAEKAAANQPQVSNLGGGIFSIDALMGGTTDPVINTTSNEVEKTENAAETTSDVQMETTQPEKVENTVPVQPGEGADAADTQAVTVAPAEILAAAAPSLANQEHASVDHKTESASQNSDPAHQNEPEPAQSEPEVQQGEPAVEFPAYFEPGRYEGLPNDVYHAANGISSTQVKDARVSLMYFNARHVEKTIVKERSAVLDMGNLVHALALQPEQLDAEFSVEPVIPEGAFTTAATLRAFIDEHNASLPALLSADDIKVLLEEYNATLPPQVPLGANLEETAQNYMALPADFQRIDGDQKQTATAMKACIKEYNATLPTPVKTSGSRDALLEQLAIINPDLVAQEAQKPAPLKVSGTKADMIQAVKAVKPDAVFADELLDAWRDNPEGKVLVTHQQLSTALNIQKALLAHPTAGMLLTHPSRAVEVSYFGFDEETGLEVRVRPDLEIDLDGVRIGADLKTISMWNVKQESLRARLHREIIERDYHLSAAMYCETAALDQFFWIFVNKDENYHWIAIIEASAELLELGMLEYRKAMRAIATGFDTGEWPAPITTDYTDELNDFDLRRLEVLRTQA
ncbi:RecE family exodeoxyribonuclease [Enterobacter cloacae]|uniref:RecE family exodeoxyribonuclease n=4 Tax=Enterobacter TaxID=547 RepID=UPI0034D2B49C